MRLKITNIRTAKTELKTNLHHYQTTVRSRRRSPSVEEWKVTRSRWYSSGNVEGFRERRN